MLIYDALGNMDLLKRINNKISGNSLRKMVKTGTTAGRRKSEIFDSFFYSILFTRGNLGYEY